MGIGTSTPTNVPVPPPTATSATAARAEQPPVLDGKDDDEIWRLAPAITQFRQHDPVEDGDPRFRTEARVGYDSRYLYVFVRAFDTQPDSIRGYLARRDQHTPSDFIHLMVDAYNDKRTGVRLTVNPLGVKRDFSISNDGNEDASWDGVWDVVTAVDAQGWTAEYRVPFSQLRFPAGEDHTFGFSVWRDVARYNERMSWPVYRRSRTGFVSQWGEVEGFNGITAPRRLEVVPYSVATNAPRPTTTGFDRQQDFAFGGDLKYGITSNITLDATVNPDFGQVEADPAQLNLSAFEQFFEERRPFFLEGAGIFSFANNLFYSRRVGRSPQLSGIYDDQDNAQNSTILGAAKITGRTAGGMNVGFLNAVTQRERGAGGATIEPMTNYMVARLQQDLRGGNSGVGMMLTSTNRMLDDDSRAYLRENAYALGVDARHRFWNNNYQVSGSIVGSHVEGSAASILSTQRNSTHQFQRPDSRLNVDSNATSLSGTRINAGISKNGGGITRFNFGATRTSAGYETNDAGFLGRADILQNGNWVGLQWTQPSAAFRQMYVNLNQWNDWNTEGTHLNSGANVNLNGQFNNQWWFWTGWNVNGVGASFDDRAARGGPVVRRNLRHNGWLGFETDNRNPVVAVLDGWFVLPDEGGTTEFGLNPEVRFRIASNVRGSVGVGVNKGTFDTQWYGNVADGLGGTAYTFARLEQTTTSVTTRVDYTMSPTLSLQVYAQPFVTAGKYSDLRELVDGRALRHDDRYAPYAGTLEDFNFKQFRSNTVLRWEYRPGSVLFLVWQQGRGQGDRNLGSFDLGRDMGDLFRTRSDNTFLIKGSYWFSL
jgi:hypothetical protein